MSNCPICNFEDVESGRSSENQRIRQFSCRRCGSFDCAFEMTGALQQLDGPAKAKLSGWARDQSAVGGPVFITRQILEGVLQLRDKSISERLRRLLQWAVREQRLVGGTFAPIKPETFSLTYSENTHEIQQLLNYLLEAKLLTKTGEGYWQVTARGFLEDEKDLLSSTSNTGFVAMWFDAEMTRSRLDIMRAIEAAGYDPVIVDNVEHINKIDDEIMSQIRRARFVVADYTGQRGGVYFEAGFAMGLGLPTFFSCRVDWFNKLHFDIRQYNCLRWETNEQLAAGLQRRIEAILGRGARG